MKLLVAVPAFNEADNIGFVLEEVKNALPDSKIVVIDDGSDDDTSKVVKDLGVELLQLPFNLGVGGALRTAFKYAYQNEFSHLVQIDADGQHDPTQVKLLISGLTASDIVIGSRFAKDSSSYEVGFLRRLAMRWLAALTSFFCKTKLTDVSSGFRITNRVGIELFTTRYPSEYLGDTVESLIIAHRSGLKISEVPVTMRERISGSPSQNFFRSTWYLTRATLVILLAALHSNPK